MLAEQAAWAFVEENKAALKYDLVALHPPFVSCLVVVINIRMLIVISYPGLWREQNLLILT